MQSARIIGNAVVVPSNQVLSQINGVSKAVLNGTEYVALPHNHESVRLLRNMGFDVISPLLRSYNWSGHFKPLPHQEKTAEFFTLNPRCFCTSGMGAMKTISALWAADYLIQSGLIRRVMIVSTLSTLERVWGDHLFIHFPHRTFNVLHGNRTKRLELLKNDCDFYIINHDGIEIISKQMRSDIDLVIIDEVASFRNHKTAKWTTMKNLLATKKWVWGLTGTPTPNFPTDVYGQMRLILPENYNYSFTRFKNEVMRQVTQFKWVPRQGHEQVVAKLLSPCIRYELRDCVNLPPTIFHDREAALSSSQKKHIDELMKSCVTEIGDKQITAVNAASLISKIVQTACGVVYSTDGGKIELDFGPRYNVLLETIEEANSKVMIFVPFTAMLNSLVDKLRKNWTVEIIQGSVPLGKRNKIFSAFQSKKDPQILVAHPETMSHGLNLTVADTIIWYAPITSGDIYPQANARIARPGQKMTTNIVHIYATKIERDTYRALKEKGRLQDIILNLTKLG